VATDEDEDAGSAALAWVLAFRDVGPDDLVGGDSPGGTAGVGDDVGVAVVVGFDSFELPGMALGEEVARVDDVRRPIGFFV
jgi:hypothetical protein